MRKLLLLALLATACSYSAETVQITLNVLNIPAKADHLDVFICSPAGSSCTATNATVTYRPGSLTGTGAFTVVVDAFDRTNPTPNPAALPLASGTASGTVPSATDTLPVKLPDLTLQ